MKKITRIDRLLEVAGCIVILSGITIEVILRAPIGYITISCGALMLAAGGMVYAKFIKGR